MGEEKEINEKKSEEMRIEVMMPLETITGKYANFMRVGHTSTEFVLDYCMVEGMPNAHSVARIIINPLHMKSFTAALQKNIRRYEEETNITLPVSIDAFLDKGVVKKENR